MAETSTDVKPPRASKPRVSRPISKLVPIAIFCLSLAISLSVSYTFYSEHKKQISVYQLDNLEQKAIDVEQIYTSFINETIHGLSFLNHTVALTNERKGDFLNKILSAFLTSEDHLDEIYYFNVNNPNQALSASAVKSVLEQSSSTLKNRPEIDRLLSTHTIRDTHTVFVAQPDRSFWVSMLGQEDDTTQPSQLILARLSFKHLVEVIRDIHPHFGLGNEYGEYLNEFSDTDTERQGSSLLADYPQLVPLFQRKSKRAPIIDLEDGSNQFSTAFYASLSSPQYPGAPKLSLFLLSAKHQLQTALNDLRNRTILLGFIMSLVALALAALISRRLTRNVERMLTAISEYEQDNETSSLPVEARDEMGLIARSMRHMMETINDSVKALEEQKFALDQHAIVGITDIKGTITYANDFFCDISGYTRDELLGQNHRIIRSDVHPKSFFTKMYKKISKGEVWKGEICNKAKDGTLYWVDTTIVPIFDTDGNIHSYIGIRTNITAAKKLESELTYARDTAEAAVEAKSQFLASMSHEIRTPMNGVLGMLGLLLNSGLSSQQKHRVEVAQQSAESLLTLINDILDFSKIEAGKLDLELLAFNPHKLFGEIAESMAHIAHVKGLELIFDLTRIPQTQAIGDPSRIRQVVTNLVNNAIKFTSQGEVVVTAATEEVQQGHLQLTISIRDTGIGIPPEKLEELFESFTQADASTTREFGGTGLGLSIAKNLCLMMGGDITVESQADQGSTFTCTVLLQTSDDAKLVQPDKDITGINVLIVDDNQTNREVLQGQLENWGAQVTECCAGDEALKCCDKLYKESQSTFDIAILDMQMPHMDGAELGQKLKQDERFKPMKLVMMTSINFQGDTKKMADLGFSAYFPKPATTSDLFKALQVLVEDGEALERSKPLVTGDNLGVLKANIEGHEISWPAETRVLLVEDNQINQMVALSTLKNFGLGADIANNGLEAISSLSGAGSSAPYNLVLMDCQMPEMDGYEATKAIRSGRAGKAYQHIPIIAMTANAMQGDKEKCLEAGMTDYLTKPINNEKLLLTLLHYLNGSKRTASADKAEPESNDQAQPTPQTEASTSSDSVSEENLSIWGKDTLLERVYGNHELLITLLQTFVSEKSKYVTDMQAALATKNWQEGKASAHLVKGVCGQLCARKLQKIAEKLEHACAQSQGDFAEVLSAPYFESIEELHDVFVAELASLKENQAQPEVQLSSSEIRELLQNIERKLENSDFIEPELITALKQCFASDDALHTLSHSLIESINLFDNDAASATLKEIIARLDAPN